ncbi:MAG: 50S ribosomal protein L11 methyltransferase [Gammaproteobacteria bacterium]|nr:50S ribosomal protein L11 methyltransferase [Gammaproteobacteria bacterium]
MSNDKVTAWRELSFLLDGLDPERAEDALLASGALSVTLSDNADQPVLEPRPGEMPLWQHTRITGLYEGTADLDIADHMVCDALGLEQLPESRRSTVDDRDWSRVWLDHFKPLKFGSRLWIVPTAYAPPEPEALNILLDPGLAFGTGTHPTTALCLEWLDGLDLEGKVVVDYGCGSGILAIAAAMLGAQEVIATDIDPQALTATRDNAQRNKVLNEITTCLPEGLLAAMAERKADVVVANILAGPLSELASNIEGLLAAGGEIALAGLLDTQAKDVAAAYTTELEVTAERDTWVRLSGQAKA